MKRIKHTKNELKRQKKIAKILIGEDTKSKPNSLKYYRRYMKA